jgi:hypothetical protein
MLLQEPGFSLMGALRCQGFYSATRAYTTPPPATATALAALGPAGPVELPSPQVGGVGGVGVGVGVLWVWWLGG